MKKFLALVLALVMTMSLVTISAGAEDFTDDASITYEEAVDVMSALGYDAAVEGYTGTNWSVSVAKRALNVGLNKGLSGDFVGTKALTREEACLYAFNTLKATMVKYNNSSTITVGDIVIQNNSKAELVDTQNDNAYISNDGYVQFAEEYFTSLRHSDGTGVDDLGRPSHGWAIVKSGKTTQIGNYAGSATLTYTAAVSATDMAKNLKGYTVGASIPVITNSATGVATSTVGTTAAIAALTGNGKTVEIFISNNAITKIVVIAPALGKITNVVATTANKTRGG